MRKVSAACEDVVVFERVEEDAATPRTNEMPTGARSGERRVVSAATVASAMGVFLLDGDGASMLTVRGWRGEIMFEGYWEATPDEIRAAISLELESPLEVHGLVDVDERQWVVLRRAVRYSQSPP